MVTGELSYSRLQDPGAAGSSRLFEIVKTLRGIYWLCCHLLSPRRGEREREREREREYLVLWNNYMGTRERKREYLVLWNNFMGT